LNLFRAIGAEFAKPAIRPVEPGIFSCRPPFFREGKALACQRLSGSSSRTISTNLAKAAISIDLVSYTCYCLADSKFVVTGGGKLPMKSANQKRGPEWAS
jgi:hypothetical protein